MLKFEFSKELSEFRRLMATNKITHEYAIPESEKDVFLNWVKVLSSAEFKVDADLDNIQIKKYSRKGYVMFRIKVSGEEVDLKRWCDNLNCVSSVLNNDFEITYISKNIEQEQ